VLSYGHAYTQQDTAWCSRNVGSRSRCHPKGGRRPIDKHRAFAWVFWVLDNGAKWKDLPKRFGSKSSVQRWFLRWVKAGVFDHLMHSMGRLVEEQGRFRLYECFVDGTFGRAKGGESGQPA
jgi:transposase